jgi:Ni/Co efflux regulator RcnB
MKTSSFRSIGGKIMMGLVLATIIGSMEVTPALAKDDHNRKEKHDKGRYEHRGRGYDHDRYERGRRVYRPYGYRERVYVSPPVYYEPPPPPGISIFLPPILIH